MFARIAVDVVPLLGGPHVIDKKIVV